MDLKAICSRICGEASRASEGMDSPVAYVRVRVGRTFPFSDDEFQKVFHDAKWDSPVSTADLDIIHEDELLHLAVIDSLTGFLDEDGRSDTILIDPESACIDA